MSELKIKARHLTADLYNCKQSRLDNIDGIKDLFPSMLSLTGYSMQNVSSISIDANHFSTIALCSEGHVALHVYKAERYVAVDVFLCMESAEPEKLFKELRKFFQPDKTRTIQLKRGDFNPDIKPQIKIKFAPLKKIRNTGAKVVRSIARKISQ